ncbi:AP2-containing protein [Hordeum vulgare]|nr:AP2-containing protein [Hordeum vulgare]
MLVPQGIKMKEITTKKTATKKPSVVINAGETDEEAIARFAREHPEYVQAELEHYWKREAEQKKKEDEAGPSTVIPIESSSEEDWEDFSTAAEEEGCDDPEKEDFWEQFRSSDDEE